MYIFTSCRICYILQIHICSPPVRWGLLDFIRAVLFFSFFSWPSSLPALRCNGQAAPDLNGELASGVGSAGPRPESSRAEWAAPDLDRGAYERGGKHGASAARKEMPEEMSERMPKNMPERMSEEMPERMSEETSEDMSENMSEKHIYQKICQKK